MTWVTRSGKIVPHEHFTGVGLVPKGAAQAWDNKGCYYRVKMKAGPMVMLSPGDYIVYNKAGECLTVMTEKAFRYKFIDDGQVVAPRKLIQPKENKRVVTSEQLERIVTGTGPIQADVTPDMFGDDPAKVEKVELVQEDEGEEIEYADDDELAVDDQASLGGEGEDEGEEGAVAIE